MVMADDSPANELAPRQPSLEDLRDLCRELNQRGALYVVVGGFAMRAANYNRQTMDVDLIVAADAENRAQRCVPVWLRQEVQEVPRRDPRRRGRRGRRRDRRRRGERIALARP